MEFGYIEAPHKSFPVVFDSPRNRGLRDFALKKILVCNQVHEVGREEVGDAGLWWLLSWEPWWSLIWSFRVRRLLGMVTANLESGGRFHIRMQIVCKSYANRTLSHYTVSHPGRDRTDVLRQGSVSVAWGGRGHSQWESTETAALETRLPLRGSVPLASLPGTVVLPAHRMAAMALPPLSSGQCPLVFMASHTQSTRHSALLLITVNYKVSFSLPRKLRLGRLSNLPPR